MTSAQSGLGTQLLRATTVFGTTGAGSHFKQIAEVTDISGPGESLQMAEVTNHDSSAVERVSVIPDGGELSLELNFLPDNATQGSSGAASASTGLRALLRQETKKTYRIFWAGFGKLHDEFEAYVTGFEPSAPAADSQTASATLSVTGTVTSSTST